MGVNCQLSLETTLALELLIWNKGNPKHYIWVEGEFNKAIRLALLREKQSKDEMR